MDTTCTGIINANTLNLNNIGMTQTRGIEFFVNLMGLTIYDNPLTNIDSLPPNLQSLIIDRNRLTYLPNLPNGLLQLSCSHNNLQALPSIPPTLRELEYSYNSIPIVPSLPSQLRSLACSSNGIQTLGTLPPNLVNLQCSYNQLSQLPTLPASLREIQCSFNNLTQIPALPYLFVRLECSHNQLTSLPNIPPNVSLINCASNRISSLPNFPWSVTYFYCDSNQISTLGPLHDYFQELSCSFNLITNIPRLPLNLINGVFDNNLLTSLPALPSRMRMLSCSHNQLTSLPDLPPNLSRLECSYNQITRLPAIPAGIWGIFCNDNEITELQPLQPYLQLANFANNNITCFPIFPGHMYDLQIFGNPNTCVPNYVQYMDSISLALPLCDEYDFATNPLGCPTSHHISGQLFQDNIANCTLENTEIGIGNIPVHLLDSNGNNLYCTFSSESGKYGFDVPPGAYTISVTDFDDSYLLPCHTTLQVNTTAVTPSLTGINFPVNCNPVANIFPLDIHPIGIVFPGQNHVLSCDAGVLNAIYHDLNCIFSVGGKVEITVDGPVTFNGVPNGALSPDSIMGNRFVYLISDFHQIGGNNLFQLNLLTDTSAVCYDNVQVEVRLTPNTSQSNAWNRVFYTNYWVTNSHDPNDKSVYPSQVLPGFQDYLTYTIRFQNTGNAPAFNIRLEDTLDTNLDLSTFQVINYSHENRTRIVGNKLTVLFPNIMLADSFSNEPASHGFIQYRVKPKANRGLGTSIQNTAYIYFDFNTPIRTNTVETRYVSVLGASDLSSNTGLSVFPNPNNGTFTLRVSGLDDMENRGYEVYNMLGQMIEERSLTGETTSINLEAQPCGLYLLKIKGTSQSVLVAKQ